MVKRVKATHIEHSVMSVLASMMKQSVIIQKHYKVILKICNTFTIVGFAMKESMNILEQLRILLKKSTFRIVPLHISSEDTAMIRWENWSWQLKITLQLYKNESKSSK